METQTLEVKITRSETTFVPTFARVTQAAFGGKVAILPSRDVLVACDKRLRNKPFVMLTVVGDCDDATVYQIGYERILVMADTGESITIWIDGGKPDEEAVDLVRESFPQFAHLI